MKYVLLDLEGGIIGTFPDIVALERYTVSSGLLLGQWTYCEETQMESKELVKIIVEIGVTQSRLFRALERAHDARTAQANCGTRRDLLCARPFFKLRWSLQERERLLAMEQMAAHDKETAEMKKVRKLQKEIEELEKKAISIARDLGASRRAGEAEVKQKGCNG